MSSLESIFRFPIDQLPFIVLVLIIALTVHEFSHAFFAYKFGDSTPKEMGRVTLNPVSHISLLGMLLFVIAGIGWARPVMINRSNFKQPRLMGIIVSFVGPFSNFVLGFLGAVIYAASIKYGWTDGWSSGAATALHVFLQYFIMMNVLLFVLNLIPLPPLDGYRILEDLLPLRARMELQKVEHWGFYIILVLVFIPPLYKITIGPILDLSTPIIQQFVIIANKLFF